jgi:hypothetical protein
LAGKSGFSTQSDGVGKALEGPGDRNSQTTLADLRGGEVGLLGEEGVQVAAVGGEGMESR